MFGLFSAIVLLFISTPALFNGTRETLSCDPGKLLELDSQSRVRCILELNQLADLSCADVAQVVRLVQSTESDAEVMMAVAPLSRMIACGFEVQSSLSQMLLHRNVGVVMSAARGIALGGLAYLELLRSSLLKASKEQKRYIILGSLNRNATIDGLIRQILARELDQEFIREWAKICRPLLHDCLNDRAAISKEMTARAIIAINEPIPEIVPDLIAYAKDLFKNSADASKINEALTSLSIADGGGAVSCETAVLALSHRLPEVRLEAAKIIQSLVVVCPEANRALARASEDSEPKVREAAHAAHEAQVRLMSERKLP